MGTRWWGVSRRRREFRGILKAILAILAILVLMLIPASLFDAFPSICLFRNLSGAQCPGCGMTRAIVCVLHGDLGHAMQYNGLVVIVFPLLCYLFLKEVTSGK